jgi:hypothetical protein
VGCGGDDGTPDAGDVGPDAGADADADAGDAMVPGPAMAVFDPPGSGALSWGDVPFPHDLYLGEDGTVDIEALHLDTPLWSATRELINTRRGFCTSGAVHFPIDGRLDPASVPGDAEPGAMPSLDDAIILFDADPDSPDRGALIPLRVEWNPVLGELAVLPVRGALLAPNRTYAAALTDRVLAEDGTPLGVSEVFAAVRDGGGDARAERARAVMMPGLDTLGTLGVSLDRVVSLAVFTTDAPGDHAVALRDIVDATPAPVASFDASSDQVWRGAELDVLLGRPSESRPGWDVAPMAGEEGSTAMVHETVGVVLTGSFMAPRVVEGGAGELLPEPPLLGADGLPMAGPLQRVPFTLIVPSGADVTDLPVVIFHTGTGDHRQLAFVAADTTGAAGFAILAIDPFLHGERSQYAVDDRHYARELMPDVDPTTGPDGLYEHTIAAITSLFGIGSADGSTDGAPIYLLGALAQQAADDMATIRLVREGDWSAIAAAAPELTGLAFDPDRIVYYGANQGAAVASAALPVVEGVAAAALYSPFGSWVDHLAESVDLELNFMIALASVVGSRSDGVTRRHPFDPSIDLYRWVIEPIEPAPAMRDFYGSATTPRPHLILQSMEFDEWVTPPTTDAFLAGAKIPGVGDFDFAVVETTTAPVSGNVTTAYGPRTAVAYEMPDATHFAILQATGARTVAEPLIPPFERLDPEEVTDEPIIEVHAQITHFLQTLSDSGVPEVCEHDACVSTP